MAVRKKATVTTEPMRVFTFTLDILRRFLANFFFGDDGDPDVVFVSGGLGGDNLGAIIATCSRGKNNSKPGGSSFGISQSGINTMIVF